MRPTVYAAQSPARWLARGIARLRQKFTGRRWRSLFKLLPRQRDTNEMSDRNVLGGELQPCGAEPLTGYYRDGCCSSGPEDVGRHTICAVMTAEFLEHQRSIGNDLLTPVPE